MRLKQGLLTCISFLCLGCTQVWYPNCGSYSIYQAHVMTIRGYQTRIAITPTEKPGIYHAQAQALIDGEWRWLKSDLAVVYVGEKESTFPVHEYKTLRQATEDYK